MQTTKLTFYMFYTLSAVTKNVKTFTSNFD